MFSWGVITIATSGVHNFASLAATRFLIGIFEAGESVPLDHSQPFLVSLSQPTNQPVTVNQIPHCGGR